MSPRAAARARLAQISLRLRGSRPVVGSSRNSTCGRVSRLDAMSSRRRMPPELVRPGRSAACARPNRSSSSPARRRASSRVSLNRRAEHLQVLHPVSSSSTTANCPVRPISPRTAAGSRATSRPKTCARPPSGNSSVARIRTSVVLPAPFGPSRPNTIPRRDLQPGTIQRHSRPETLDHTLNPDSRHRKSMSVYPGHRTRSRRD